MKFLTTNFVRCPISKCDNSLKAFPLQYKNCELIQEELEFNPEFLANILDRLNWEAIIAVAGDLGNDSLPPTKPENVDPKDPENEQLLKDLHTLLIETQITEGEMHCGECGHIYYIKSSIPNFLLPPHLV
ncbi:RNA methylation protein [Saccharomycopsis crataegensis]|uniref:Multifunctional methyltransferase subunit trm112 n=1 Tax=Saccharomycopsis crataegensis TaxID=43959 RepID=A0AAV5QK54_9ASCO|nr:RNA methylation protein [Saccharomycopsis crataegensis]